MDNAIQKEIDWVKVELMAIDKLLDKTIEEERKIELLLKKTYLENELDRLYFWKYQV